MVEEKDDDKDPGSMLEAGLTTLLPEEPSEGEEIYSDHFKLVCTWITENPKCIVLPKILIGPGTAYKDQVPMLLGFEFNTQLCANILKAVENGFKNFEIHFLDPETDKPISVWSFLDAKIRAVDFGYVAQKRPDKAEIAVEIDYQFIEIK